MTDMKKKLAELHLEMNEADKAIANSAQQVTNRRLPSCDFTMVCQTVEDLIEIGRYLGAQQLLRVQAEKLAREEKNVADFLEATKYTRTDKDMNN